MKDVFKNYKKYWETSRKQTQYLKNNWSFDKMTERLDGFLNKITISKTVQLKLPKLPKLPKLKQDNQFPKLKKQKI
jgi:hypothetical protein